MSAQSFVLFSVGLLLTQFGASTGRIEGRVLRLDSGTAISKVYLELIPAEIGSILDYSSVETFEFDKRSTQRLLTQYSADGAFEFPNVPSGRYRLAASRDGFLRREYGQTDVNDLGMVIEVRPGQRISGLTVELPPAALITGVVLDENGKLAPLASVEALAVSPAPNSTQHLRSVQTAQTNDRGEYRLFWLDPGEYYVAVNHNDDRKIEVLYSVQRKINSNVPSPKPGYPTYYYPNTPELALAQLVHLRAGSTVVADIKLDRPPLASVRGVVSNIPPELTGPLDVQLMFVNEKLVGHTYSHRVGMGGKFEIDNVPPGDYVLRAITNVPGIDLVSPTVRLHVGTADVQNITLPLVPGLEIRGHVSMENSGELLPFDTGGILVTLFSGAGINGSVRAVVSADGSLRFTSKASPDVFDLSISGLPAGVYLKKAVVGSTDILRDAVKFEIGSTPVINVVLGTDIRRVTGRVTGGKSGKAAVVVLVPVDELRHRTDRYRRTTTDLDSEFAIDDVPPGTYYAYAWDGVPYGSYYDRKFLDRYSGEATLLTVRTDQDLSIELKLIASSR